VRRRLVSLKSITTNRSGRGVAGILPSSSAKDEGGRRRGSGSKITCAHSSPRVAHDRVVAAAAVANHPVFSVPRFGEFIGRFPKHPSFRKVSRAVVLDP
jgi:hypothetical protein